MRGNEEKGAERERERDCKGELTCARERRLQKLGGSSIQLKEQMGFSFSLSSIISRRKLRKSHLLGPFIFHAISITVLYIASSSIKGCGPEGCWSSRGYWGGGRA